MNVSPATTNDIPALCQLLATLFSQEAEFQPDEAKQSRGLARIIDNPSIGHILVGRQSERLIGMVSVLYTVSTALGEPVAWLEDMVVAADMRNSGVGTLLLKQAVLFAEHNGCKRITLLTDRDNLAAQRFYRRQGFATSPMIPMRLGLN